MSDTFLDKINEVFKDDDSISVEFHEGKLPFKYREFTDITFPKRHEDAINNSVVICGFLSSKKVIEMSISFKGYWGWVKFKGEQTEAEFEINEREKKRELH